MCISFCVLLLTQNTILATTRAAGARRNTHSATRSTLSLPGTRTARTGILAGSGAELISDP